MSIQRYENMLRYTSSGMEISYTDVRFLTNTWAKDISMNYKKIHVAFHNSDGKQQTLTSYHTTHHASGTAFQTNKPIDTGVTNHTSLDIQIEPMGHGVQNYGNYKIKKKETIPSFPDFDDRYASSTLLGTALLRDIAWAVI